MALKLITPPAALAVSLADIKTQLRIDDTAQDAILTTYIGAATKMVEHATGRRLITQTVEVVYDAFGAGSLELPVAPVQSVTSITYIAADGSTAAVPSGEYVLDAENLPGHVHCAADTSWPATADAANAVRVRFVVGYGDTAADVPENARAAIILAVKAMEEGCFADGESVITGSPLLDDLKVWSL